ncbi:MAG: sigma-70 family RNA polymerase sigma factor [Isosphaeraceae bacterium]
MARARSYDLNHQVQTLFGVGSMAGLSDAELLDRFNAQRAEAGHARLAAEAAFEVLVDRHGPMVLGVCRRALSDPGEIEDAFQATFLVLVRRAPAIRGRDSLGRWLYGVARRVAAKARYRSRRDRARFAPLAVEPAAPELPADRMGLMKALDEEVSRLPEKYRRPVILCHLEGRSHAEAAARLQWPVGTVSGRLSRARGLLKDRLAKRGLGPAAGSVAAMLVAGEARAAVPASLAATTAQAASTLALGGTTQAAAVSASALFLLNEVVKGAFVFKPKAAGAIILAVSLAGVAATTGGSAWVRAQGQRGGTAVERQPAVAASTVEKQPSAHRPADEIVKELEQYLKTARAPHGIKTVEEHYRTHNKIADLVDELRTAYPDDPRSSRYMIERWTSLYRTRRRAEALTEVRAVLRTSTDRKLRADALFIEMCLTPRDWPDGRIAFSRAEAFASGAPGDKRAAIFFSGALDALDGDWWTRVGLTVAAAVIAAPLAFPRRWWKYIFRPRDVVLLSYLFVCLLALCGFWLLAGHRLTKLVSSVPAQPSVVAAQLLWGPVRDDQRFRAAAVLLVLSYEHLRGLVSSGIAPVFVTLAAAAAVGFVIARNRRMKESEPRMSTVRLEVLGFLAVLMVLLSADACVLAYQAHAVRDRILREYPDSPRGRLIQGERRQVDRIGQPFELEFNDAITGKHISMKDLRGKVVVVDFWATWCDMREMWWLYGTYHDMGIEIVGVTRGTPEEDGGLNRLKKYVKDSGITWPQMYLAAYDWNLWESGEPSNDFIEFWGVNRIPTVFLIDQEGKLYSTQARGQLETLIPQLLGIARPQDPRF